MQIPPTALLVNDDLASCLIMEKMLQLAGLHVLKALNGQEALSHLHGETPSLIITDDVMPGMFGVDLIRVLRADPRFTSVPIMLTTVQPLPKRVDEALAAGADEVILMPLMTSELIEAVSRLLQKYSPEPFAKGSALLIHGVFPERGYLTQLCEAVRARIGAPVIALPSVTTAEDSIETSPMRCARAAH